MVKSAFVRSPFTFQIMANVHLEKLLARTFKDVLKYLVINPLREREGEGGKEGRRER